MEAIFCQHCKCTEFPDGSGKCANCGCDLMSTSGVAGVLHDDDTTPGVSPEAEHATDPVGEALSEESRIALCIEYQHPPLVASKHACIPFRITNTDDRTIKEIRLSFDSKAFRDTREPITFKRQMELKPRSHELTRQCDFFVSPVDGFYRLGVSGFYWDGKDGICAFRGSKMLIIRDADGEKPSIMVKDGGVLSSGAVDIDELKEIIVTDGGVLDVENLHRGLWRETDQWIGIDLFEDIEQTRILLNVLEKRKREKFGAAGRRRVKPDPGKPLPDKALFNVADDKGKRTVCIWKGRECRLGRTDKNADLSFVLLPHTKANEKRNSRISRVHCRLTVSRNRVKLEDCGSKNNTFVEGCRLEAPATLRHHQVISLANVASFLFLEFRSIEKTREVRRALNSCQTVMDCGSAFSTLGLEQYKQKAPLDAFLLRRQDAFCDRVEYLFIVTAAVIGASKTAAIRIYDDSVSEHHARLLLANGQYLIEDLHSESGTFVNGEKLIPFEPVILNGRATLSIGDVNTTFQIPKKGMKA